jgi:(p)ppGpp synthase/HD superfamily hydrolase
MADLERALQIAVQAHAGQKDRNGEPYIFHPIRVMTRCTSPDARIVALLHDVVEDTPMTFEQISAAGFSPRILSVLRLVTHAPEVSYEDYIATIATDPTATEVKIADLEDNSDIRRLQQADDKTMARVRKYVSAYLLLTAQRDAGHVS